MQEVVKLAEANGFVVVRQRTHLILKRAAQTLTVSVSPRCPFAAKNALGDLRRLLKEEPQ